MNTQYTNAPHREGTGRVQAAAPNAALLVDFDNVTMGMRSDLSKDLRKLLDSEVIRGKVTVQRAYADWRRYPQYIVPLSENSIDLIFAPAYGSSKKNATDIRMAIDGMELVFTRPEIGTYILLTGDSDFSSLVLKLKEYGKYVIGVGIQESSSDILVQNCDEYYSYTNLAGLQKTDEAGQKAQDPWVLVEKAVKRMRDNNDVMRSDRLKQVMMEIDPAFDEGNFGFSKFSKFMTEAASRGLVGIKKMDNGQYEVSPTGGGGGGRSRSKRSEESGRRSGSGRGGRDRSGSRDRGERTAAATAESGDPMKDAYGLLQGAMKKLAADGRDPVRDSDVKRKMLEVDRSFDEGELGFSKFSLFLQQADEDGEIVLSRRDTGNYQVSLGDGGRPEPSTPQRPSSLEEADAEPEATAEAAGAKDEPGQAGRDEAPRKPTGRRLGRRRGTTRRRGGDDDAPSLFEGQVVGVEDEQEKQEKPQATPADAGGAREGGRKSELDLAALGLPTDATAAKRYLANSYGGVGVKTAEALTDEFGDDVFHVLHSDPGRIESLLPSNRAETVLDAWNEDLSRRRSDAAEEAGGTDDRGETGGRGGRGGPEGGGGSAGEGRAADDDGAGEDAPADDRAADSGDGDDHSGSQIELPKERSRLGRRTRRGGRG